MTPAQEKSLDQFVKDMRRLYPNLPRGDMRRLVARIADKLNSPEITPADLDDYCRRRGLV